MKVSRTPTTLAAGFLFLDAVLLGYAGLSWSRPLLTAVGALCGIGGFVVILVWRRYRRTLSELEAARREMKSEVESIRGLLERRHLNN
jgi:hypothetical protein